MSGSYKASLVAAAEVPGVTLDGEARAHIERIADAEEKFIGSLLGESRRVAELSAAKLRMRQAVGAAAVTEKAVEASAGVTLDASAITGVALRFPHGGPIPPVKGPLDRGLEGIRAASGFVGQFITLSAALLAFSVSFNNVFKTDTAQVWWRDVLLGGSWVALALAILAGLLSISGVVSSLDARDREPGHQASPFEKSVAQPALAMVILFLAALVLLAASMSVALLFPAPPAPR